MRNFTIQVRVCLKIRSDAVSAAKAGWRGATRENTLHGSSTKEQRSQPAFAAKTLRAAGLLPLGFVVAGVTARCGDAPPTPPRPNSKSLAAAALPIFRQALREVGAAPEPSGGCGSLTLCSCLCSLRFLLLKVGSCLK